MHRPISRWQTRATGRKPSPRFASVVGHTQMRAPASRRRSSSCPSACVACTTVVRGPRQPVAGEQLDRPQRRARRGTPRSRAAARRRARAAAGRARRRTRRARASASAGHARTEWGATPTRIPSARSASSSREVLGDRLLAEARDCRRGGSTRRGRRTRCRPPRPPRRPRAPRRGRGSGTRRPPCSRSRAARGRPRRTRGGSRRRSATRRARSSSSRHAQKSPPPVAAAQGALERVAVGVDEAGNRERRHARILSAWPPHRFPNALTIGRRLRWR